MSLNEIIEKELKSIWWIHSDDVKSMKNYYENFEPRLLTDKTEVKEAIHEVLKQASKKLKEEFEKNDWENNTLDVSKNRDKIIDKVFGGFAKDNTNENHSQDEVGRKDTITSQKHPDTDDLCECGHPKHSHEIKGFIEGKPTGSCYRNWGESGCDCKKFVKQNKGGKNGN